jgi:O-antigen ligase
MYVSSTVTPANRRDARSQNSALPTDSLAGTRWFSTGLRAGPEIALLAWWLAYQVQYLLQLGGVTDVSAAALATVTTTRDGSPVGVLLVTSFAAIGACYFPRAIGLLQNRSIRIVLGLLGMYLIWGLASYTWTVDPVLTIRRWVQFALLVVGSVGLGLGWYGSLRDGGSVFARHVVIASVIAMGCLLLLIARSGSINVLDPDWAAKAIGAGTWIAYPIAFGVLAGVWLWARGTMSPWRAACFLGLCLASLLAVKGRFLALDMLILTPVFACCEPRFSWRKTLLLLSLVTVLAYGVALASAIGGEQVLQRLADVVWSYATLDANAGTGIDTLDGRVPLWEVLFQYVSQRPWLGYGFGAFWNPDQMQLVWSELTWHPPVGHNGFLDETLGTGLIGLLLFLSAWLAGIVVALRLRVSRQDGFSGLVLIWLLFFLILNTGDTIMQTYFQAPFVVALTALFALLGNQAQRVAQSRVGSPTLWPQKDAASNSRSRQ